MKGDNACGGPPIHGLDVIFACVVVLEVVQSSWLFGQSSSVYVCVTEISIQ